MRRINHSQFLGTNPTGWHPIRYQPVKLSREAVPHSTFDRPYMEHVTLPKVDDIAVHVTSGYIER